MVHKLLARLALPLAGLAIVFALVASAAPTGAQANLVIGRNASNFGVFSISPGFQPDPRVLQVVSGGELNVEAQGLGAGCVGFVTSQPDLVLNLNGVSSMLRFFVRSNADTTLVVNDARGNWHCNDDVASNNTNPMVTIRNAPAGHYDLWIGSYQSGVQARGTLHVTELESQTP